MTASSLHEIEQFKLHSGAVLPRLRLAYRTYGTLSVARDNAVLFPTWFSSRLASNEWIIGPDRPLDPARYFVICAGLLGNGESSSPSNAESPYGGPDFPIVNVADNVAAQYDLVRRCFGIERLRLVIGRSMGAQVAFQWACLHPAMVGTLLALTGSARTTPHNQAFLAAVRAALTTDCDWKEGHYQKQPVRGLRAVGLMYAGWVLSQAYYREGLHLREDTAGLASYLENRWAKNFLDRDANDLLAQAATWHDADVSRNATFEGNWKAALAAMDMPAIVMPCRTDLFFPPEDSAAAVAGMPRAELRVIESLWGHRGAGPGSDPKDVAFLGQAISELLALRI